MSRNVPLKTRRTPLFDRQASERRGAVLLLTVFLLIGLFGMVAFSVDVAYMHLTRAKLRSAVDAAARAASEALSRTQDPDAAKAAAQSVALANQVAGVPLTLDDEDVVPGAVAINTSGAWTFSEGGSPTNGIRVTGRRVNGSPDGPVNLFFGRVLGVYDFQPVQSSTVVRLNRDIVVVVDRSSSMKLYIDEPGGFMSTSDPRFCQPADPTQSRWAALEGAINVFAAALGETGPMEYVGLVSYGSNYTDNCGNSHNQTDVNLELTNDLSGLNSAMADISANVFNGGTQIDNGVIEGHNVLSNGARPYSVKTLIVMTDGYHSNGSSGNSATINAAQNAADDGVVVYTITFGDDANQSLMASVASAGGGVHYHAPDPETLEAIFLELAYALPVVLTE